MQSVVASVVEAEDAQPHPGQQLEAAVRMRFGSLIGLWRIVIPLAVTFGWLVASLGAWPALVPVGHAATGTFQNTGSIAIPGTGTQGPAAPYPSEIVASGLAGTVTNVTVTLSRYTHTFPLEVQVLLVGPTGANVVLMARVGVEPQSAVTLTFDDAAASTVPNLLVSGTFRPTINEPGLLSPTFPASAPPPPFGSMLNVFNGTDPNGTWQLFVLDTISSDVGSIAGGWSLTIETMAPTDTPTNTPTPTQTPTPSPSATPTQSATPSTLTSTATPTAQTPGPTSTPEGPPGAVPSGGSPPRPATPTPRPDCGQTGVHEASAPPGYATDPHGPQGQNHPAFATGLTTLSDREAFRASLPADTNMAAVNDAIARGCSPAWIKGHLTSSTTIAQP